MKDSFYKGTRPRAISQTGGWTRPEPKLPLQTRAAIMLILALASWALVALFLVWLGVFR